MSLFSAIYGVFAFIFFVVVEIIIKSDFYRRNQVVRFRAFRVPHLRIIICTIFFPIVVLIALIETIVESIMDRRDNK